MCVFIRHYAKTANRHYDIDWSGRHHGGSVLGSTWPGPKPRGARDLLTPSVLHSKHGDGDKVVRRREKARSTTAPVETPAEIDLSLGARGAEAASARVRI